MSGRRPFADATARRHQPRDRAFDLLHLRVEVSFDLDAGTVRGRTTQTFTPIAAGALELVLDAVDLDVRSVTADGKPLDFVALGSTLRIQLGEARPPGERFDVAIDYEARPRAGMFFIAPDEAYPARPRQVWTQGEMEDTRHWLPVLDAPDERTTAEVLVTVPRTWTAISNGALVATRDDAATATRTFHWRLDATLPPYLLTIAAGEMDEVVARAPSGLELRYLVPKGRAAEIERSFGKTPRMVDFFESYTGVPYPWPKYAQVVVNEFTFGGMENTSATTLTDRTLHDERAHLDYRSEPLVAHELAHQWWGDLVTCRSWGHIWLNESFATYFEALWAEHDEGQDELHQNLLEKADAYFKEDEEEHRRAIVEHRYTDPSDLFDRHSYEKGALVLHALRALLGDDGFRRGIRLYLGRHREQPVETDQLRRAFEDATGRSLDGFFEQWLLRPGHPEVSAEASHDAGAAALTLKLRQTQERTDGTPVFRLPLRVRVYHGDGTEPSFTDHAIELAEAEQTLALPCPRRPLAVTLDPGNTTLKKLVFERPLEWLAFELRRAGLAIDRTLAARALGRLDGPRVVAALGQALREDAFWGVRAASARALGKVRGDAAVVALLAGLGDAESRVRTAAASALGEARAAAAVPALTRLLDEDRSYYARAEAARALGKIRGDGAYATLARALAQDSHGEVVRRLALEGLAELGDKQALALGREWAAYGRPPRAREAAILALGKLAGQDRDVRLFLEGIAALDRHIWARECAFEALGEIGDEASLPVLERASRLELDGRLRRAARLAMARVMEKPQGAAALRREIEALRTAGERQARRIESLESRLPEERK